MGETRGGRDDFLRRGGGEQDQLREIKQECKTLPENSELLAPSMFRTSFELTMKKREASPSKDVISMFS